MRVGLGRGPRAFAAFVLLIALQAVVPPPARGEEDPLGGTLFPPELVLRHVVELRLEATQVDAIKREIQQVQPLFLDRQLELQTELGKLRSLLAPGRIDEAAALAQLDRILELEREVKRAQIGLLVRIKNLLGAEQQQRLEQLRDPD